MTRETDYAFRVVLDLAAAQRDGQRRTAEEIASRVDVPYRFLRNVCRKLVQGGLLESRRGNCGGLALRKPSAEISVLDVMRIMEPKSARINRCLGDPASCARSGQCPVHSHLGEVQKVLDGQLDGLRFDRLCGTGTKNRKAKGT